MSIYSWYQWLIFLFIYCFIGWVWETAYVSVRQKRFVNRGFLYGPQIPIYGFGAVSLIMFLRPIKDYPLLTYFAGVVIGSLLEIVTGWTMEKIFHVRYWDYSKQPYNFKGYICLVASLFWGLLGYLLIHHIHTPIERLVLSANQTFVMWLSVAAAAGFVTDFVFSFISAYGMRKIIDSMQNLREELERARAEAEEAIKEKYDELREEGLEKRRENVEKRKRQKESMQAKLTEISEDYARRREIFMQKRAKLVRRYPNAKTRRSLSFKNDEEE